MYERMLDKHVVPTVADMTEYCGVASGLFGSLNEWLSVSYGTVQQVTFPYGNQYGWGIAHRLGKKLICNIFAENNGFTVMIRLSDKQFESVYVDLQEYAKRYVDNRYHCGDGGWIHYRVANEGHLNDIQKLIAAKFKR